MVVSLNKSVDKMLIILTPF